ncbi:MAG TPA: WcbI family polysaccharide biosynthesis putative acetyltransferase [Methylocystis sp.]|jgi:hypothetical protein
MLSQIDKQIIRSWRRDLIAPHLAKLFREPHGRSGPRIAVVGNCQSYGVAYAMKLLDPSATVDHFSAIGKSHATIKLFAKTLESYDYVFSHEFPPGHLKNGGINELRGLFSGLILFPAITFQAFHPDLIYLLDETHNYAQLHGPLGPYQSALGVFAYRKGLSLEEANALFNHNVFEAVGYLNLWDSAANELINYAKLNFAMDLSFELLTWARRGVFMYSSVHPKGFVLYDVAKKLFATVGLPARELDFEYYAIHDLARSEIFPIYPPIGESLGVPGSYLFKLPNYHISAGVGDFLNLPQYLAACYKIYQSSKSSQMRHPRVDNWLSDDATSEMLARLARENLRAAHVPTL